MNLQHYKIALTIHLKSYFHKFKMEPLRIYALYLCNQFMPLPFSAVYSYTINDSGGHLNIQIIHFG